MLYMCENINLGLNTNVYHNLELGFSMKVLVPDYLYCIIHELKPRFYYYFPRQFKRTNVREQKNVHMLPLPAQFAFSIQVIFLGKNLKYISEGKKDRKLDFIKLSPPCSGGGGVIVQS